MPKPLFPLYILTLITTGLPAQTLITDMGTVRFFNTLDSAKSAWITAISHRCYCLLEQMDSTHSMRLKLDMDTDANRTDTAFYFLDYNILSGDFMLPTDSSSGITDSSLESPGIYIKARDSVIHETTILRLLDYGIHHYSELKRNRQAGKIYDRAFVSKLLAQKPSLKLKRAMAYCK